MESLRITIDLEDPTFAYLPEGRYVKMTRRVLDFFDAHRVKATFFAVGRIALSNPALLREIAARGHEIGYHGHSHLALTEEDPALFRQNAAADKDLLEQITGTPVSGFRAPYFSLTTTTLWATEKLQDIGFRYSSSVMPTSISRFGMQKVPQTPFRWPCGLVEFPMPVQEIGPFRFPYLGGIYLYALPFLLVRRWLAGPGPEEVLWSYAHPYDFDREESFCRMPRTSLWVNIVLRAARYRATRQLERLIEATERCLPLGSLTEDARYVEKLSTYAG